MKITKTTEVDDTLAWEAIFGALHGPSAPWITNVVYLDGAAWDKPGRVLITMWNDENEDGDPRVDVFDVIDMQEAYQLAANGELTHCNGGDVCDTEDPDACSAEMLLQLFMYGSVVYG